MLAALVLLASMAHAQPGQQAPKLGKKLTSVSYRAVVDCFPELADDRFQTAVDPVILKQKIDEKYPTEKEHLLRRTVQFREPNNGQIRRARLEGANDSKLLSAQWESVSEAGQVEAWHDPKLKTQGLGPEDVTALIGKGVIQKDETETRITKMGGYELEVRKDLKKILGLRFSDRGEQHQLKCRDVESVGLVCTCAKKNAGT